MFFTNDALAFISSMLAVSGPLVSPRAGCPTQKRSSSEAEGHPLTDPHRSRDRTQDAPEQPYLAQETQPIEPILFPKLRIRLAEFPYATLFYAPETAHLGDLMRIKYGHTEGHRISPLTGFSRAAEGDREYTENRYTL